MSEEEMRRIFSSNIEYLIRVSGKQQREVAEDLGVAPTTFNTWCVGKILPSLPKLQKVAEYLGVRVEDLIAPLVGKSVKIHLEVTPEEAAIIRRYRATDEGTRSAVAKLLDVTRENVEGSKP